MSAIRLQGATQRRTALSKSSSEGSTVAAVLGEAARCFSQASHKCPSVLPALIYNLPQEESSLTPSLSSAPCIFLNFYFIFIFMCISVCLCVCLYITYVQCLPRPEEGIGSPGIGLTYCWEIPCGCWELDEGPLEEKPVLLTSETSLCPLLLCTL